MKLTVPFCGNLFTVNSNGKAPAMAIEPTQLLASAFPALNPQDLEDLANLATINTYPPDTILCHEGAYEHTFYLISKGTVVITKRFDEHGDLVLREGVP